MWPAREIHARLDGSRLFAHVDVRSRSDMEHAPEKLTREISFALSTELALYAEYRGRRFNLADNLSRALLEELLGLDR